MTKRKALKIVEQKLGREAARGQTFCDGIIYIDPRQSPKLRLNTVCHEVLHNIFPEASETEIDNMACQLSSTIWKDGYRRVEMEKPTANAVKNITEGS
jgi:hypothetical protein